MIEGCRAQRSTHGRGAGQSGRLGTPAPNLLAYPTVGSDPSDAERAARAVLAGETSGVLKSADGRVEMIRALRTARRSAIKARTQAANQLQGLRLTAPEELLNRLRGLSTKELVSVAARLRLGDDPREVTSAAKFALRSVARRYDALSEEIAELDVHLDQLVAQVAPGLVSLLGIGADHSATLLVVALKTTPRG
jgi:transposase